jgi:lincosamide nucleotidyltransferase A/C/D/E
LTAGEVLDAIDRLDGAGIGWWIDGGWGVDALLGEETRPHDDLDLVVERKHIGKLHALFPEFERVDEEWWPARFVLRDPSGRQVDFHPVEFDSRRYPADGLRGRGRIGGREVRCLTPELQLRHHDYATGGPDDVDWHDVRLLCERFGLQAPSGYAERPGYVDPKRKQAAV